MKNKVFLAVGVLILVLLAGLAGCSATGVTAADAQPINVNVGNQQTGISVNGQGKVTVTPDIALVYLGVSAKADKVADAQAQAAAAMDKIMAALKNAGVDEKDIQTQYYSIQQYTDYIPVVTVAPAVSSDSKYSQQISPSTPTTTTEKKGFEVSNTVTVKIRTVANTGSIIDAVAVAGGDNTRINGINFSVDNPEQYYGKARELAMQDAQAKAQALAGLAKVTLGKATFISESTSGSSYYPTYAAKAYDAAGSYSTSISAGQSDIVLNVQVSYDIQ